MTGPQAEEAWSLLLAEFSAYEDAVAGLAPPTVANHRTYLTAFARWWNAHRAPRDAATATAADLAAFLVAESSRGLAPRTRRAQAAALRRFYGWLVLTERATANPAAALSTPRASPPRTTIYSPDEIVAILDHTATLRDVRGQQRHVIVAMLRYTGMRSGELRTLHTADLDLHAGRARVVGKGSRERTVLLPNKLMPIVADFLHKVRPALPDSPLLVTNPHCLVTTPLHGMGHDALRREVELAALGAGVPGRHYPHRWRHTFATELVRSGVDIHLVQRLLGHRSIASTVIYTHLAPDDLRGPLDGVFD